MHTVYPDRIKFGQTLKEAGNSSFNFIVVVTAALVPSLALSKASPEPCRRVEGEAEGLNPASTDSLKTCLDECVRVLKHGGLLFVQGRPDYLGESVE